MERIKKRYGDDVFIEGSGYKGLTCIWTLVCVPNKYDRTRYVFNMDVK